MSFLPLRAAPVAGAAAQLYDEWLGWLAASLGDLECDRNELCRRILTDIYFPEYADVDQAQLSPTVRVALAQMDPRNVTLEPEYYDEIDLDLYAPRKPLLWLWEMFDRSALGENVELGIHFRKRKERWRRSGGHPGSGLCGGDLGFCWSKRCPAQNLPVSAAAIKS